MKENIELIRPQPTEQSPLIVEDYPYGFRLRTKCRYWIDTKEGKGQRVAQQTLNPKTQEWNKPKKSTYSDIRILYRNKANGHIENEGLSFAYDGQEELALFLQDFGECLTEWQENALRDFRAIIKTRKYVKVTISGGCKTEAEQEAHDKQQEEVKKRLGKIYSYHRQQEEEGGQEEEDQKWKR